MGSLGYMIVQVFRLIFGLGVSRMRVKQVRSGWNRKWQSITVFRAVGITVPLK